MNAPIPPPDPPPPFGPDDTAALDLAAIQKRAEKTRQALTNAQSYLTRLRYGPGPDNQDPPLQEVTRADGQWPYLLIRTYPGDAGGRPVQPPDGARIEDYATASPDIIITPAGPSDEPKIVDRSGLATLKGRGLNDLSHAGNRFDIWVHVWNLGHTQATGVRVRVRLFRPKNPDPNGTFLGGTALDLGDRLSNRSHLAVKAVTFTPPFLGFQYWMTLIAIADCLSDPSSGDLSPGADRHVAILREIPSPQPLGPIRNNR